MLSKRSSREALAFWLDNTVSIHERLVRASGAAYPCLDFERAGNYTSALLPLLA